MSNVQKNNNPFHVSVTGIQLTVILQLHLSFARHRLDGHRRPLEKTDVGDTRTPST